MISWRPTVAIINQILVQLYFDIVGLFCFLSPISELVSEKLKKMVRKEKTGTMGEVVTREYTINLHKRLHGIGFKYRAPRAVKVSEKFSFLLRIILLINFRRSKSLLKNKWGPEMCELIRDLTRRSGPRAWEVSLSEWGFVLRGWGTRTRTASTSCTPSSPTYRWPREGSRACRRRMWKPPQIEIYLLDYDDFVEPIKCQKIVMAFCSNFKIQLRHYLQE